MDIFFSALEKSVRRVERAYECLREGKQRSPYFLLRRWTRRLPLCVCWTCSWLSHCFLLSGWTNHWVTHVDWPRHLLLTPAHSSSLLPSGLCHCNLAVTVHQNRNRLNFLKKCRVHPGFQFQRFRAFQCLSCETARKIENETSSKCFSRMTDEMCIPHSRGGLIAG